MKFQAHINIMTQAEILDPQGKVVTKSLNQLGFNTIQDVRIGKHITYILEANSEEHAKTLIDESCKKLLANMVMEGYEFSVCVVK